MKEITQERARGDGHRPARRRAADRHAVRRRAAVRRDRPRGLLRRPGADPRRAHRGAGRQAVRRGAQVHRRRPATAASASSSSPTTRTTPTRSATGSCCSSAAGAWATSRKAEITLDELTAHDGRRRRARGSSATSWRAAAVPPPSRAAARRRRYRSSASAGSPRGPRHDGRTRRLALGSCPDSWGVWFADDPLQTPWQRFLDELAGVGYRWLELGRTATCRPTRPGSPTSWTGAG